MVRPLYAAFSRTLKQKIGSVLGCIVTIGLPHFQRHGGGRMFAAMVTRRWWMFLLLFSGCADEEAATLSQPVVCAEGELSQGGAAST